MFCWLFYTVLGPDISLQDLLLNLMLISIWNLNCFRDTSRFSAFNKRMITRMGNRIALKARPVSIPAAGPQLFRMTQTVRLFISQGYLSLIRIENISFVLFCCSVSTIISSQMCIACHLGLISFHPCASFTALSCQVSLHYFIYVYLSISYLYYL